MRRARQRSSRGVDPGRGHRQGSRVLQLRLEVRRRGGFRDADSRRRAVRGERSRPRALGGILQGAQPARDGARRFSSEPRLERNLRQRGEYDSRLHQYQHVSETVAGDRASACQTDRTVDRACAGRSSRAIATQVYLPAGEITATLTRSRYARLKSQWETRERISLIAPQMPLAPDAVNVRRKK